MSRKKIEELEPVSHTDVEPLYSAEEICDKLATTVKAGRDGLVNGEQKIILELIYSLAKAILK